VLRSFPLLLLAVALYNALAAIHGFAPAGMDHILTMHVPVKLFSGEIWQFSVSDLIIIVSLGLLFIETIKSTRTTAIEVINHALSMLVFIVALIEFITMPAFATSSFFLIVAMTVFDIVAGFTISIVAAKRDLGVPGGIIGTN
jgi:hypothetical protein